MKTKSTTTKKKTKVKPITTKHLDDLWAKIIKERADNRCEYCKNPYGRLNSHHIFSRSNHGLRWDISNGICLCATHHILGNFSAHKAPLEFAEWLIERRGRPWYEELKRRSKQVYPNIDKKVVLEQLKNQLEQLSISMAAQLGLDN